ncbi:hypothetical protein HUW50_25155 [Metabacillus sp. KUDC1714]|uniref:DUF5673 domain-containing protein n=1 Tax=Metabacillus elymi TaxID=2745198 RepID=A0ABX6SC61_9BACI|nr:hypothetical protein HUW50_25155 [Metabacillus sp. KUDC1714]
MVINILFTIMFILGVYYLINYRLRIKKAADLSKDALYPKIDDEFNSILLPIEWKEMEPLAKNTKSYQYVKWGTLIALLLLLALLWIVLATEWLGSSFFSVVYLFIVIINSIKHRGNLFILSKGIILNGKFYSSNQIKNYQIEKIVRWHELYGLDDRVNNAYKITFKIKKELFPPNYIVVKDSAYLERMILLLDEQGIPGMKEKELANSSVGNFTTKS